MIYTEEVVVGENIYQFSLLENDFIENYKNIVIYKSGELICNFDTNYITEIQNDLEVVSQRVVDYILGEALSHFCFMLPSLETFEIFNQFYSQISAYYIQRKRTISVPSVYYVAMFDRI